MNGKLAICILDDNEEIKSKRVITVEWSPELETLARNFHDANIRKELYEIMWQELLKSLDKQTFINMVEESLKNGDK